MHLLPNALRSPVDSTRYRTHASVGDFSKEVRGIIIKCIIQIAITSCSYPIRHACNYSAFYSEDYLFKKHLTWQLTQVLSIKYTHSLPEATLHTTLYYGYSKNVTNFYYLGGKQRILAMSNLYRFFFVSHR